jgi:proteasome lid subunit RPN8/RPN11
LLGSFSHGQVRVDDIALSENITPDDPRTAFEVDPALYLQLQKAARAGGAEVIGVWHSHPSGRAEASEADKARSVNAGWVWLITATSGRSAFTNAFWAEVHDPHSLVPLKQG